MGSKPQYEVAEDADFAGEWRVEGFGLDGECYVAIFSGPKAEHRAKNYAAWLNMTDEQPTMEADDFKERMKAALDAHTQALREENARLRERVRLVVGAWDEFEKRLDGECPANDPRDAGQYLDSLVKQRTSVANGLRELLASVGTKEAGK